MFLRELAYILVILLTMAAYFVYKRKQPDRAKENRPYFVLIALLCGILIATWYVFFVAQRPNGVVSYLILIPFSLTCYVAYRGVLLVPEKVRGYLIVLNVLLMMGTFTFVSYANLAEYKELTNPHDCVTGSLTGASVNPGPIYRSDLMRLLDVQQVPCKK